jgi:hypothetical protein
MGGDNSCTEQRYTGTQTKRLDLSPSCYYFTDCFFSGLTTTEGGAALHFQDNTDGVSISRTTFHLCCSANNGVQRGGAIFAEVKQFEASATCVAACAAEGLGSFANLWQGDAETRFAGVSCVSCAATQPGYGTINSESKLQIALQTMNFTDCVATSEGSALSAGRNQGGSRQDTRFTSIYVTCVDCRGGSVFHSSQGSGNQNSISDSNFYNNSVSIGVICAANGIGLSVSNCIFRDSNGPEITMEGSTGTQFVISNCVFSGWFSWSSSAIDGGGNVFSSLTLSHVIALSHTGFCPTLSPTRTPSVSPSSGFLLTACFSPTRTVFSHPFNSSHLIRPSQQNSPSSSFFLTACFPRIFPFRPPRWRTTTSTRSED